MDVVGHDDVDHCFLNYRSADHAAAAGIHQRLTAARDFGVSSRLIRTRSLREPAEAPVLECVGRYCQLHQGERFSQLRIEFDHTGAEELVHGAVALVEQRRQ